MSETDFNSIVSQVTQLAYRIASGYRALEESRNPFTEVERESDSRVIPIPEEIWSRLGSDRESEKITDEVWSNLEDDQELSEEHRKRIQDLSRLGLRYMKKVDKGIESLWDQEDTNFFWTAAFYEPNGAPVNVVHAVRAEPGFTWKWLTHDYFLASRFASSSLEYHGGNNVPMGVSLKWSSDSNFLRRSSVERYEGYMPTVVSKTEESLFRYTESYHTPHRISFSTSNKKQEDPIEWWKSFFENRHKDLFHSIDKLGQDERVLNKSGHKRFSDYFATVGTGLGVTDPPVNYVEDSNRYTIDVSSSRICAYAFPLLIPPPSNEIDSHLETSSLAVLFIASTTPIPVNNLTDGHLISQTLAPIASKRMQDVVEEWAERKGGSREKSVSYHELSAPVDELMREENRLSERNKMNLNYVNQCVKIGRGKIAVNMSESMKKAVKEKQVMVKKAMRLAHRKAYKKGWLPIKSNFRGWEFEELWEKREIWLDYKDFDVPLALKEDKIGGKPKVFSATWIFFLLANSLTHSIRYSFDKCSGELINNMSQKVRKSRVWNSYSSNTEDFFSLEARVFNIGLPTVTTASVIDGSSSSEFVKRANDVDLGKGVRVKLSDFEIAKREEEKNKGIWKAYMLIDKNQ